MSKFFSMENINILEEVEIFKFKGIVQSMEEKNIHTINESLNML